MTIVHGHSKKCARFFGNNQKILCVEGPIFFKESKPETVFHRSAGAFSGQGGAGNVFWNLRGERYPANRKFIVDSQQARRGMVIGTGGSAFKASWKSSGLRELIGRGDRLEPQSLWLDQVNRRDQREAAEDRKKQ